VQIFVFGASFVAEGGAACRLIMDDFHLPLWEFVKVPYQGKKMFHLCGL